MLKDFEQDLADLDLSDEVKVQIKERADARASGLISKKDELINKLNKLKDEGSATQAELEQLRQLKNTYEQQQAESQGKYQEALEIAEKRMQSELEKAQSQLAEYQQREQNYLINDGLNRAFDKAEIKPELKPAVEALFKSQATVTDGQAMIGDKSLSEYIQEWAKSDEGAPFVLEPHNSGGNANGSSPVTGGKSFSDMSLTERSILANTNPALYEQLSQQG